MKAAHCPENCCSQTFDWKLFSRCHQLVRDEVLCQSLFVCKVCRASDNSSLLTALHRKCQRCVTLSVTRTSSSNHQVTLLTHQPPKEFKVPVCGRTLRRNDAAEFMFGAFFFSPHSWLKWKCFVFSDNTTWVFFFLCRHNIFGADGEIWGRLWFKRLKDQIFCLDLTHVSVSFTGGKRCLLCTLTNSLKLRHLVTCDDRQVETNSGDFWGIKQFVRTRFFSCWGSRRAVTLELSDIIFFPSVPQQETVKP